MEPDRQHHDESYRGHEWSVDAQREGERWTWWYTITPKGQGKVVTGQCAPHAKLTDPEAAMRRAIQAARLRADELG